jgi:hypothetical protein
MDHQCRADGCQQVFIGPEEFKELDGILKSAGAGPMGAGGFAIEGPNGIAEFYCSGHAKTAYNRQRELHPDRIKKPKVPKLSAAAEASMGGGEKDSHQDMPVVTGPVAPVISGIPKLSPAPNKLIVDPPPMTYKELREYKNNEPELIIVCQKDRILGVFSDKEKAKGIRRMAESLSPEPVYCQHWKLDEPGAQIMDEPEPPCDEMEAEHAVQGKRKGRKKGKRVQQESAKEAE